MRPFGEGSSSSRGPRGAAGGTASGNTLAARMQKLLAQQRSHQEKLLALAAAGTLREHVLIQRPTDERSASAMCSPVGKLGCEGDGAAVTNGPLSLEKNYCTTDSMMDGGPPLSPRPDRGPGHQIETPLNAARRCTTSAEPARCLEMRITGPCTWEGHLATCQVIMKKQFTSLTSATSTDRSATTAFAVLQSKGLPQGLGLDIGCTFTVHRPWFEVLVQDLSAPTILVFCLTPSPIEF